MTKNSSVYNWLYLTRPMCTCTSLRYNLLPRRYIQPFWMGSTNARMWLSRFLKDLWDLILAFGLSCLTIIAAAVYNTKYIALKSMYLRVCLCVFVLARVSSCVRCMSVDSITHDRVYRPYKLYVHNTVLPVIVMLMIALNRCLNNISMSRL